MKLKKNKYGKRIKTYAQLLGITTDSESDKKEENKYKSKSKKKVRSEKKKTDDDIKM